MWSTRQLIALWLSLIAVNVNFYSVLTIDREDLLLNGLLESSSDDLVLLFTGDPQFYFECVNANVACKAASEPIRRKYSLDFNCNIIGNSAISQNASNFAKSKWKKECVEMESTFSNDVQRRAMGNLVDAMASKPSALIINGDLTGYGHLEELEMFKKKWLNFPISILPGLGNHDYDNNVNDCVSNHCANRMLFWLTKYANEQHLSLDYKKRSEFFVKTSYTGSFAYSKIVCSESGSQCAMVIQLHNRLNYATRIEAPLTEWTVLSSVHWLQGELRRLQRSNSTLPIFINLHHMDDVSQVMIKRMLTPMIASDDSLRKLRIFVLFAHVHQMHSVQKECVGRTIPFIFVGSIPYNRFSAIRVPQNTSDSAEIYMLSSNENGSVRLVHYEQFGYNECNI